MLLPELQSLASSLRIAGTGRMRKGELIAAIQMAQSQSTQSQGSGGSTATKSVGQAASVASADAPSNGAGASRVSNRASNGAARTNSANAAAATITPPAVAASAAENGTASRADSNGHGAASTGDAPAAADPAAGPSSDSSSDASAVDPRQRRRRGSSRPTGSPQDGGEQAVAASTEAAAVSDPTSSADAPSDGQERQERPERQDRQRSQGERQQGDRQQGDRQGGRQRNQQGQRDGQREQNSQRDQNQPREQNPQREQNSQRDQGGQGNAQGPQRDSQGANSQTEFGDDFNGSRRRGRFRERRPRNGRPAGQQGPGGSYNEAEPVIREDDVLVPIAGILDILDNYAFVRTSGYLTGPNDVYVSLAQVRRHGLRRGDAITGAVRQPVEGEKRDKYNAMVRLDTVNGLEPEEAKKRPEFTKLTPLYPNERLRLETEPNILTTRVIDLVMPLGKGQRALIVSPPKAGKTMVLQAIANAITTNNPECHLMVVLVDERPEEVTDMQRSVKGEVIASTFDRPPTDHTSVAELSIERAKRLVEMGHDVVVLLDSITRLGRAYNLAAPTSGRILSGGVDSTALYPPKRFLGAARNIEHGGSLTILATALVETGSTMDTVIFEEFKGTGNAELKLDRRIADKRIFPAVDIDASGTRKEELLLAPDELAITYKLRRVLHALDSQQGIELLIDRLKQSRTNYEFLMQIAKTTPGE
jgi:transcription termination factor Rho